jgi:hypothetical protein
VLVTSCVSVLYQVAWGIEAHISCLPAKCSLSGLIAYCHSWKLCPGLCKAHAESGESWTTWAVPCNSRKLEHGFDDSWPQGAHDLVWESQRKNNQQSQAQNRMLPFRVLLTTVTSLWTAADTQPWAATLSQGHEDFLFATFILIYNHTSHSLPTGEMGVSIPVP